MLLPSVLHESATSVPKFETDDSFIYLFIFISGFLTFFFNKYFLNFGTYISYHVRAQSF